MFFAETHVMCFSKKMFLLGEAYYLQSTLTESGTEIHRGHK